MAAVALPNGYSNYATLRKLPRRAFPPDRITGRYRGGGKC